jgi:heme exporter protein C
MQSRSRAGSPALKWLGVAAWASVAASLFLMFFVARRAQGDMGGDLQRIFYFHVPAAWIAYLAFAVVFLSSIVYLRTASPRWDQLALASAEIGVVFTSLVLFTGPIWARPVWGTWWQWDARLTSTLVLWLGYLGYLLLRALTPDRRRAGRIAAVVGIVSFIDVPIVHFSVYWWRTLHPLGPSVADPSRSSGLGAPELVTFGTALVAFTLLFAWLLAVRVRLEQLERRVADVETGAASAADLRPEPGTRGPQLSGARRA